MKKILGIAKYIIVLMILLNFITGKVFVAQVDGASMNPTLKNNDFVLVINALENIEDQDVVIIDTSDTNLNTNYIVKRYYENNSTQDKIWVEGDNKDNSLDSRNLGTFEKNDVVGIVVFDITQFKIIK